MGSENATRLIFVLTGLSLLALSGCQSQPLEQMSYSETKVPLTTKAGSEDRLRLCATDWGAGTKDFTECWRGEKYTRDEFCVFAGQSLGNQYMDDWQKAAIYEKMRTYGCMG